MNVIAFMVLVLAVIFILFIPRISYLVRKMNSKHDDLSLKQKLTKNVNRFGRSLEYRIFDFSISYRCFVYNLSKTDNIRDNTY